MTSASSRARAGGACISSEYRHNRGKLRWRCAEGHEWETTADIVKRGCWCPICSDKARLSDLKAQSFLRVQAIAREKGGRCLFTE